MLHFSCGILYFMLVNLINKKEQIPVIRVLVVGVPEVDVAHVSPETLAHVLVGTGLESILVEVQGVPLAVEVLGDVQRRSEVGIVGVFFVVFVGVGVVKVILLFDGHDILKFFNFTGFQVFFERLRAFRYGRFKF